MSYRFAIELPDCMDVASSEQVHVALEAALEQDQPVELDGAKVVRFDTAGVQLLMSFFAEAEKHHLDVAWKETSSMISEVMTFMGLAESVGLEEIAET
jgi:ABC-type transporter Mla MlaB component